MRELAQIERLHQLPHLLAVLAARQGGLLNASELAREVGIPQATLRRYLRLLQALYLVAELPPWSGHLGKRLLKSPKVYLTDSGLAAHLLGHPAVPLEGRLWGHLLEGFVVGRSCACRRPGRTSGPTTTGRRGAWRRTSCWSFPGGGGPRGQGRGHPGLQGFRPLARLRERLGERFLLGAILHPGERALPFGERLFALPLGYLWA